MAQRNKIRQTNQRGRRDQLGLGVGDKGLEERAIKIAEVAIANGCNCYVLVHMRIDGSLIPFFAFVLFTIKCYSWP